MILRRLTQHLREQNWFAVLLELLVVILGIFLAFQVERWYANQLQQDRVYSRIHELADDFDENGAVLEHSVETRRRGYDAGTLLLEADQRLEGEISADEFYAALAAASKTVTPKIRRGSYDGLISTGQLELIEDEILKAELANFYTQLDELFVFNQGVWALDRNTFEPYVIRNLDHVSLLKHLHSERYRAAVPTHTDDQYLAVLGTTEFEGVIAAKSHAIGDEISRLQRLQELHSSITQRLSLYLSEQK